MGYIINLLYILKSHVVGVPSLIWVLVFISLGYCFGSVCNATQNHPLFFNTKQNSDGISNRKHIHMMCMCKTLKYFSYTQWKSIILMVNSKMKKDCCNSSSIPKCVTQFKDCWWWYTMFYLSIPLDFPWVL